MNQNEPGIRQRRGITPELERFVEQPMVGGRMAISARYLEADELQRMRANQGKQMHAWTALIAELREAQAADTSADDPHVQLMARRWMGMFRACAGDFPTTLARISEAYAREPHLHSGSAVDHSLLGYLPQALKAGRRKKPDVPQRAKRGNVAQFNTTHLSPECITTSRRSRRAGGEDALTFRPNAIRWLP